MNINRVIQNLSITLPLYFSTSFCPTSCRQATRSSSRGTLASGLSECKIWSSCAEVTCEKNLGSVRGTPFCGKHYHLKKLIQY